MENEFSNRISVKNIVLAGMFAAFLAVMSQVSLPMPTGVPITVQVFAVALVGVILGWKRGVLAVLVYYFNRCRWLFRFLLILKAGFLF